MGARLLVRALRDPAAIEDCDWAGLISAARAEQLIGSLAFRVEGGALHQDQRDFEGLERAAGHFGFPERLGAGLGRIAPGGLENSFDAGGDGLSFHAEGEAADQLLGAGGADQAGPVAIADASRIA